MNDIIYILRYLSIAYTASNCDILIKKVPFTICVWADYWPEFSNYCIAKSNHIFLNRLYYLLVS